MRPQLTAFTPTTVISSLSCEVSRAADTLTLHYRLSGDLAQVHWPAPGIRPQRRSHLWEHTCFEAFLRRPGETAYIETNASPSGDWHCFAFSDYRADMQGATRPEIKVHACTLTPDQAAIQVQVDLSGWLAQHEPLQLGLAAVIETTPASRHYYALRHLDARPDFHHRDSHTLIIP